MPNVVGLKVQKKGWKRKRIELNKILTAFDICDGPKDMGELVLAGCRVTRYWACRAMSVVRETYDRGFSSVGENAVHMYLEYKGIPRKEHCRWSDEELCTASAR